MATPRRAPCRSLRRGRSTGLQSHARSWACRQNCHERQQQSWHTQMRCLPRMRRRQITTTTVMQS
jgi:hypothetical protein